MTQSTNEQRNFVRSLSKKHSLSYDENLIEDFDYCRAFLNDHAYLIKAAERPARAQSFLSFSCEMLVNLIAFLLLLTAPVQLFYLMFFVIPRDVVWFRPATFVGFTLGLLIARLVYEYFNHFVEKPTRLYQSFQMILFLYVGGVGGAWLAYQLAA